jgi:hypothetical protein
VRPATLYRRRRCARRVCQPQGIVLCFTFLNIFLLLLKNKIKILTFFRKSLHFFTFLKLSRISGWPSSTVGHSTVLESTNFWHKKFTPSNALLSKIQTVVFQDPLFQFLNWFFSCYHFRFFAIDFFFSHKGTNVVRSLLPSPTKVGRDPWWASRRSGRKGRRWEWRSWYGKQQWRQRWPSHRLAFTEATHVILFLIHILYNYDLNF